MLGTLLKLLGVGIITVFVIGIVFSVIGAIFSISIGLVSFLLFRVAPFLLVGWVALRVIDKFRGRDALSDADRKWLDGD
ncbi:uncharacterized protein METZ01_LOCUS386995 [marine metagenome]|jgi:archaellum biogenesis protein FlaJ (TadC family)|uniref:Phage shock protein G n=1 Tax=marine metagenome TaxID=408172 RepID=A0A382UKD1_9ZZZZ|tara:strand:- start:251 stop:487 length:237 start_codon:yes stop_codon:yes gene_type:complete